MDKAVFSLKDYKFERVSLDFTGIDAGNIFLDFNPSGKFDEGRQIFHLLFEFTAHIDSKKNIIKVLCKADFTFEQKLTFGQIPSYFYGNSIAILFPYIRSFVSTLTLQANLRPLILPVLNLTELESRLKDNTVLI